MDVGTAHSLVRIPQAVQDFKHVRPFARPAGFAHGMYRVALVGPSHCSEGSGFRDPVVRPSPTFLEVRSRCSSVVAGG